MTFIFPSINGTVKPRERSGHIAAHFDDYLVIWGGYYTVSLNIILIGGGVDKQSFSVKLDSKDEISVNN